MSPKTLLIGAAALAASAATTLPASAAQDQGAQDRPLPLRAQIMFNLVDTNADGSVDQTEIAALQKAIFAAIDTDKDGKLSQQEFTKIGGDRRARVGQFMNRFGHGQGGQGGPGFLHRGPGGQGPDRQGQLEQRGPGPDGGIGPRFGLNQDGPTPDGFPGGQPRDFASLDTNGDGVVSADEFAAAAPQFPFLPQ